MSGRLSSLLRKHEAYWVSVVLAMLAVVLATDPFPFENPVEDAVPVAASVTDPTPVRQRLAQPVYKLGSFTYQCRECHRDLPEPTAAGRLLTRHAEIRMRHGINKRCLNCHHPTNREAFVDDYGAEIPWDQPQILCAKCHGPVYRDWQHGAHGRINGYWNMAEGPQIRLKCVDCHDPHHPPFQPLASAPPPHTLRMKPYHGPHHAGARNPLRVKDNPKKGQQSADSSEGHDDG